MAWLQRRWAWENRLAELRRREAPDPDRQGAATPWPVVAGERTRV